MFWCGSGLCSSWMWLWWVQCWWRLDPAPPATLFAFPNQSRALQGLRRTEGMVRMVMWEACFVGVIQRQAGKRTAAGQVAARQAAHHPRAKGWPGPGRHGQHQRPHQLGLAGIQIRYATARGPPAAAQHPAPMPEPKCSSAPQVTSTKLCLTFLTYRQAGVREHFCITCLTHVQGLPRAVDKLLCLQLPRLPAACILGNLDGGVSNVDRKLISPALHKLHLRQLQSQGLRSLGTQIRESRATQIIWT